MASIVLGTLTSLPPRLALLDFVLGMTDAAQQSSAADVLAAHGAKLTEAVACMSLSRGKPRACR